MRFCYIESFPNGDGYWHICALPTCGGSVGESQSLTLDNGEPFHTACHDAL